MTLLEEVDVFVVCLEVIPFGGKVFGTVTQMIALNKPFVFLVPHLRLYYPTYDTNLWKNTLPIIPEKRLGICLYRLARGDYLSTVAEMAGLAESTVCKIVMKVCNAIIENLSTDAVDRHFPKSVDDFRNKLQKMECEKQYMLLLL